MTSSIQLQKYIDGVRADIGVALHYLRQHPEHSSAGVLVQLGQALARANTALQTFELEYEFERRAADAWETIAKAAKSLGDAGPSLLKVLTAAMYGMMSPEARKQAPCEHANAEPIPSYYSDTEWCPECGAVRGTDGNFGPGAKMLDWKPPTGQGG